MRDLILNLAQRGCDLAIGCVHYTAGSQEKKPKLVAHRGAWDKASNLENTLNAFNRASALGADAVELDVHFTKDDVPVVHHDPHLARLYGHEKQIRDLSFKELRGLVPLVPTLAEVLGAPYLRGGGAPPGFFIEIKTELNEAQVMILERSLQGLQVGRDYHFLVLDPRLVRVTSRFPARAWILVGELRLASLVDISIERGLGGVAGHYLGMSNKLVRRLKGAQQLAGVGFIPNKNLFNREWKRGIDFVFTNSIASHLAGPK